MNFFEFCAINAENTEINRKTREFSNKLMFARDAEDSNPLLDR